jgi:hypothetical protein
LDRSSADPLLAGPEEAEVQLLALDLAFVFFLLSSSALALHSNGANPLVVGSVLFMYVAFRTPSRRRSSERAGWSPQVRMQPHRRQPNRSEGGREQGSNFLVRLLFLSSVYSRVLTSQRSSSSNYFVGHARIRKQLDASSSR